MQESNQEIQHLINLLMSNKKNAKVALKMLKENPALKPDVKSFFAPLLKLFSKKSLLAIPNSLFDVLEEDLTHSQLFGLLEQEQFRPLLKKIKDVHHTKYQQLESIPPSISNLKKLSFIDLDHNNLSQLPSSFGTLKH